MAGLRAWMNGRGAAAMAVSLVLVAVAIGVAAQETGPAIPEETTFKSTKDTTCWGCHGDNKWSPSMKDPFVAIQPPATMGAPSETQFNWTVDFVMTWNPKPQVPHLLTADPCLDLHNAPSLRFIGSHPDVHQSQNRFIAMDPTKLNERQQNVTRVQVDPGVTSLTWTVDPRDKGPTAPNLVLLVKAPSGNETFIEFDEKGVGGPETHTFTGTELEQLGPGNWTIGAAVDPPSAGQPPAPPQLTRVDFTLTQDALYDTASLRALCYPRPVYVNGGGRVLQTWQLKCVQEPAPEESVRVSFDTVGWYEHNPAVLGGDFAGFKQERNVSLAMEGGHCVIQFVPEGLAVRPSPVNGATVTQVSEVLGYASGFLLLTSIISGGMFGQASRRGLNAVFHSAKRRVAYHNFLSYGLTVAALAHMVIFLVPLTPGDCGPVGCRLTEEFKWHKGLLWWGGPALLAMAGLGVTGAMQVPMIRRWSYPTWKWWHYGLTVATILFTLLHMAFDGKNFGLQDPFTQWQEQAPDPLAFLSDETAQT